MTKGTRIAKVMHEGLFVIFIKHGSKIVMKKEKDLGLRYYSSADG